MFKRVFGFLFVAFGLLLTPCWAATCSPSEEGVSCTNAFSSTNTTNTYNFFGDGKLVVKFDTVLRPFNLTVTVDHTIDGLAPGAFPEGTVCVKYSANGSKCDEYDFSGLALGPNGVPVRNKDYKGLITLTLSYDNLPTQTIHSPAFLHAPGDNASAVYTEDILTGYSTFPPCPGGEGSCVNGGTDPTMVGKVPGLSSVAAFDEPGKTDCFNFVSPTEGQAFTVGQEIEVEFKLFGNTDCTGNPVPDKDARLSLARVDNGQLVFVPIGKDEGGKHFHFDREEGVNEREVDTEGLQPGIYIITVFSDEFSPKTRTVVIQ